MVATTAASLSSMSRTIRYRAKRNRPPLRHRRPHHPPIRGTRSASKSKRVEESFGWGKTIGGLARPIVPIANVIRFGERRRMGDPVAHMGRLQRGRMLFAQ